MALSKQLKDSVVIPTAYNRPNKPFRTTIDGLKKGDRVAFFCFNTPPMLEAHFAVPLAGGVIVSINTRLASQEVAYILNDCGATPSQAG